MKNDKMNHRKPWISHLCRATFFMALTAGAGLYTTPTKAQWWTQDNQSIWKQAIEFGKEAQRWGQTWQHFQDQVAFWQDNLVTLQNLQYELLRTKAQFKRLPANFGVAEDCPGAAPLDGDITSALSTAFGELTQDIATQQNAICVMIRQTKTQRFNNTVDYLNQLENQTSTLAKLANLRLGSVGTSPGKMAGLQDQTARFNVDVQQARDSWKTTDEQLEAQIHALEDKQDILAKVALNGKQTVLGTVVNAATLEIALKVGK